MKAYNTYLVEKMDKLEERNIHDAETQTNELTYEVNEKDSMSTRNDPMFIGANILGNGIMQMFGEMATQMTN